MHTFSDAGFFPQFSKSGSYCLVLLFCSLLSGCFSNNVHQGQRLYAKNCASCHGDNGEGLEKLIPPLAKSDYLVAHHDDLPCLLRHGLNHAIVVNDIPYQNVMPGNDSISPASLTNLLNYVENHWGNHSRPRTILEVQQALQACP